MSNQPKHSVYQKGDHRSIKRSHGFGSFTNPKQIADIISPQKTGEGNLQHGLDYKPGYCGCAHIAYPHRTHETGIGVYLNRYSEDADQDAGKNQDPAPALSFIQEIEKPRDIDKGDNVDQEVDIQ